MTTAAEPDLIVRREGAAGILRLNRPKAINAITLDMVRGMAAALDSFEADPEVALVLVEGAGERGLCAGGDIVALYDNALNGGDYGKVFWREEYILNARIARFSKPYVAYMDGLVMGGGVGVSAHGSHRIVTDRTQLAMPETGIGFFPDVGGTWLLSRAPGELGTYFGLTGAAMNGADAIAGHFADAAILSERWPALRAALTGLTSRATAAHVRETIAEVALASTPGPVAAERARIDRLFAFDTMEEIVAALEADGSAFAQGALKTLARKSPTSLKVALKLLRLARGASSLEECLTREYLASLEVIVSHEFREGVRAAVIDKDRNPQWRPARLDDVDDAIVARYFVNRGADELKF